MTEFKQIVGRGTRVYEDLKKFYFTLIDFRGATNHFADKDFDGEPVQIYEPGDDDPVAPPFASKASWMGCWSTDLAATLCGVPGEVAVMQLVINPSGSIRCIYGEAIDLDCLGSLMIRRASHVEPDRHGKWLADLSPLSGPILGPFSRRTEALAAEQTWLEVHWLCDLEA